MKLKHIILLSFLFLNSCSMVKVGYSIADWYIKKEILSYVKLYTGQQETLEKNLDDYMIWHKKVMIPRYINRINEVNVLILKTDFKTKELELLVDKLSLALRNDFLDTFIPLAQTTITPFSTLSEEQVQRSRELFSKKFKKDFDKRKKYKIDDALYLWKENTKDWLGSLNIEQEKWLEANKSKLLFKNSAKVRMARRGERNKMFLDIFDEKKPEDRIKLQNMYWEQFRVKVMAESMNSSFKANLLDYLSLINMDQKQFLVSKLNSYKKEVEKLK